MSYIAGIYFKSLQLGIVANSSCQFYIAMVFNRIDEFSQECRLSLCGLFHEQIWIMDPWQEQYSTDLVLAASHQVYVMSVQAHDDYHINVRTVRNATGSDCFSFCDWGDLLLFHIS